MSVTYIDKAWAASALPKRPDNSNKGSFGRLFAYVGSSLYMGAAHLSIEAALRGGVGYVELCGERALWDSIILRFPEVLYTVAKPTEALNSSDIEDIVGRSMLADAVLIGSGSGKSSALRTLTMSLIKTQGAPLIIDADAVNSLAEEREASVEALAGAKRQIILTPHPLEFSRLSGISTEKINDNRISVSENFAKRTNTVLLLKGNGTVITDGKETFVNTSGSSALAKAGSGDCLGGLLASLAATKLSSPIVLSALAAYIHGAAADNLASDLSKYGVTPSDLPKEMARVIKSIE